MKYGRADGNNGTCPRPTCRRLSKRLVFLVFVAVFCLLQVFFVYPLLKKVITSHLRYTRTIYNISKLDTSAQLMRYVDTVIFQPWENASCTNHGLDQYLVIIIPITSDAFYERNQIRDLFKEYKTDWEHRIWRYQDNYKVGTSIRYLFYIGKKGGSSQESQSIRRECDQFGDIIFEDMDDFYLNFPVKSIRMLKWLQSHCDQAKFAMKVDKDVFVNMPLMIDILEGYDPHTAGHLIAGKNNVRLTKDNNRFSKWYTPDDIWSTYYPDFVSGFFYVLGKRARQLLFEAIEKTPMFHLEDVFLTGMVREKIQPKINTVDMPEIYVKNRLRNIQLTPERFSREILVMHEMSLDSIRCLQNFTAPYVYKISQQSNAASFKHC